MSLERTLRRAAARVFTIRAVGGVGWGLVAGVLVAAGVVWSDLLWELKPAICRIAPGLSLVTLAAFIVVAVRRARRDSTADALASRLDAIGESSGRIRSGASLLQTPASSNTLTAGLREIAIAEAGRLAHGVGSSRICSAKWIVRALGVLLGIAGAVGLVHALFPGMMAAEWLRFSDPYGDHPPYSRVRFLVEPANAEVEYGADFHVAVRTVGPAVDRLDLVLQPTEAGAPAESLPLFSEGNGVWRTTVSSVRSPALFHIRSPLGRSPRYSLAVLTKPKLELLRVRITPPAYTHRPAYEGPLPAEGLTGLPGTRIELRATSNRPLSGGMLTIAPKGPGIPVVPTAPGSSEVTAEFEIPTTGKLTFHVTDIDGRNTSDTVTIPVTRLTDDRPFVRMVQPKEQSIATPTATIPVAIAAEDDYGLAKVRFFRSVNGSRPMPVDLTLPSAPALRTFETVPLPLGAFGLQPGDELRLFARTGDTDPAGSKEAETPVALIRIIAQSEFEKMVRTRQGMDLMMSKYRQAQRRMEAAANGVDELRKKRKAANPTGQATDKDREELRKLAEQLRKDAQSARDAAKPLGNDLDTNLNEELKQLAKALDELANLAERLSREDDLTQEQIEKALERLAGKLGQEKQDFEKNVLEPLEFLKAVLPLLEQEKGFEDLVARQKQLAADLAELKQHDPAIDPEVRRRLKPFQLEQEQIRQDLAKLLETIEEKANALPENPALDELRQSAKEFVEAVRTSGAAEAMVEGEAGLGEHSGKRGHAGAAKAADILDKLLEKEQGSGQGMAGKGRKALGFKPGLGNKLGKTVEQMMGDRAGQGMTGAGTQRKETGLYGGLPGLEDFQAEAAKTDNGTPGQYNPLDPRSAKGSPTLGDGKTPPTTASGSRETAIPSDYRRRVAEYFRRVIDE